MIFTRPEDQVLVSIARRLVDNELSGELRRLLESNLDWDYLLESADWHNVIPLVHYHLSTTCPAAVPRQTISKLAEANRKNTRSNLFLTGELIKILELLRAHAIQVVPFKGPSLAMEAYGDVGCRQFADLDLLVRKPDFSLMRDILIDYGFVPSPKLEASQQAALLRFDCAQNFKNGAGVLIDVHWNFVPRHLGFAVKTEAVWERLRPSMLENKQVMSLSPHDLILVLCLHGFTHFWQRLGWICDVAYLIKRRDEIDWRVLMRNASSCGVKRIVSLGLLLAHETLGAQLPPYVLATAREDRVVRRSVEKVQRNIFQERSTKGIIEEAKLQLLMRERPRDKIRSLFGMSLMPRHYDWMFVSMPVALSSVYYLVRPIRWARDRSRNLLASP